MKWRYRRKNEHIALIPKPEKLILNEGSFKIKKTTRITINNKQQQKDVNYLSGMFEKAAGFSLNINSGKSKSRIIFEKIPGLAREAYQLEWHYIKW